MDTTRVIFVQSAEPQQSTRSASPAPSNAAAAIQSAPEVFPVLSPIDIPKQVAPINSDQLSFDPKNYINQGTGGGSNLGVPGGVGSTGAGMGGGQGGGVLGMNEVDNPVQQIDAPKPHYPPVLRSAGIEGTVELQYVVDTTGRVERNSVKVLSATHEAFVGPAKDAILKAVFKPAKVRHRVVPQLVRQLVSFKIEP